MASEYNINLSNGSVLATLYPLETNGPDNFSTPRLMQSARPLYPIAIATPGTNTLTIAGDDYTDTFRVGFQFEIAGSTGNDGTYTVQSSSFSGNTQIVTNESFTDPIPDGSIIPHIFILSGDISARFISGFQFDVQNSGEIDGTYTVTTLNSVFANNVTIIPVGHGTIRDNINTPIALPLGQIQYVIYDSNTVLKLPGKGVVNYGEMLIENLVRMTENFAADDAPELNVNIGSNPAGDPLTGQLWYNTTFGEEGFKHFDGTIWTSDLDTDSGSLIFRDVENSNADIYITGSETFLPAPWPGGGNNKAGLVIWTQTNPADGEPIFRVLSATGSERLVVEHHSVIGNGFIRTANNLDVQGTADSYIYGTLAIGHDGPPTPERTLTVEGNGIAVNAASGSHAYLVLDAPATQTSAIHFETQNVNRGEIQIDDNDATKTLQINGTSANNVSFAVGGGQVGVKTNNPSADLDVNGTGRFSDRVGINNAPPTGSVYLEVTGDVQVNSQILAHGIVGTDGGLPTAPAYAFNFGSNDLGMYRSGSDQIGFTSAGVLRLTIDDTYISPHVPISLLDGESLVWGNDTVLTGSSISPVGFQRTNILSTIGSEISLKQQSGGVLIFTMSFDGAIAHRGIQADVTTGGKPNYVGIVDTDTGMRITTAGSIDFWTALSHSSLTVMNGAALSVAGEANYETLVIADDDIPNKKYVDDEISGLSITESQISDLVHPYDILGQAYSTIADGQVFLVFVTSRAFTITAGGHQGYATTAPSGGAATITVSKNGGSIGTVVFNNGSNTLSSETIGSTSFAIGDRVSMVLTTGNGMEDFGVTLNATAD